MRPWRLHRSRSVATALVFLALTVAVAGAAQEVPAGAGETSSPIGPLSGERFCQLLIERQKLEISSCRQVIEILDADQGDVGRAVGDLIKHEQERTAKHALLFTRFGVRPEQYYRDVRGTSVLDERSAYLNAHPEVLDQIVANSKELRQAQAEVERRLARLWAQPPR